MEAATQLQTLQRKMTDILATPTLCAYARALSVVDEYTELASSAPDPRSPAAVELLRACKLYKGLCAKNIRRLNAQVSAYEHKVYDRAAVKKCGASGSTSPQRQKHRGVIFDVDKGEHVAAALEALQLEDFLSEQGRELKKVRFSS
ncbi:hypothetical protein GGS24DRAFT_98633 [Hypoxylon argillaceum]|nr:hypothetical protein GGS24DRAFT_98633 [Hypoxylon argillaceum]KAI1154618.1 hypothetical protein F4825DRAFT_163294 [Nemania diffusa]